MPFSLYKVDGQDLVRVSRVNMVGKNTIYNGWIKHGRPFNQGWHMDKNEIISLTEKGGAYSTHRIIIDLAPKAIGAVFLLELLDIYGFTYASDEYPGEPEWTPLMFRMRDAFRHAGVGMDADRKASLKERFRPINDELDIFEFVYLRWNWNPGRVGQWNAALLHSEALQYFKQFL